MELMLMSTFQCNINKPTAATFCLEFMKYAVSENDFQQNWTRFNDIRHMMEMICAKTMTFLDNSLYSMGSI